MLHEAAWFGKPLGPQGIPQETVSSKSFVHLGDCDPATPFQVELYGQSGLAAIGVSQEASEAGIMVDIEGAEVHMGEPEDFFVMDGVETFSDIKGHPLEYILKAHTDSKEGVTAHVTCTVATPVVVVAKDKTDFEIHAQVTETKEGDEVEILGSPNSRGNLEGRTKPKKNASNSPVSFDSETGKKIRIKHQAGNSDKGIALIDGYYISEDGYKVRRTLIRESKLKKDTFHNPSNVNVKCCDITDDGDVEVDFPGVLKAVESLQVDIRIGITVEGVTDPIGVVDVRSMLTQGKTMTVHGGWIRKALASQGLDENSEGWDVVVLGAVVSDPEEGYEVIGVMKEKVTGSSKKNGENRRQKLSQKPSPEEVEVTDEMRMGRKPSQEELHGRRLGGSRRLSANHKKILVHGYCSQANPFPIEHFSNAIAFVDPSSGRRLGDSSGLNNWSHETFAKKIDLFAIANGIDGCNCIAHSQGGNACTHLYANYWSCLDYGSGSRMIQSVGTPFQGTPLAGNLAALGDVFGAGCGTNNDLTTSGASNWLDKIPSWARSRVYYYTTSFKDVWYAYDYCHQVTDLFLGDPDDGTTEKSRGQLSGANNRGHKSDWCHTTGMRDTAQYYDSSRNSEMNFYA